MPGEDNKIIKFKYFKIAVTFEFFYVTKLLRHFHANFHCTFSTTSRNLIETLVILLFVISEIFSLTCERSATAKRADKDVLTWHLLCMLILPKNKSSRRSNEVEMRRNHMHVKRACNIQI